MITTTKIASQKGFTVVELIVVMSIFAIMAGVVLFRYKSFGGDIHLQSTAQDIAIMVQQAQNYAISGRYPKLTVSQSPPDEGSNVWKPSYGVYFNKDEPKKFAFFYDINTPDTVLPIQFGQPVGEGHRGLFDDGIGVLNGSGSSCGVATSSECLDVITITTGEHISHIYEETAPGSFVDMNDVALVFTRPFPDRIAGTLSGGSGGYRSISGNVIIQITLDDGTFSRNIVITPLGQITIKSN